MIPHALVGHCPNCLGLVCMEAEHRPGDFTVCLCCCAILRYEDDGGGKRVRIAGEEVFQAMPRLAEAALTESQRLVCGMRRAETKGLKGRKN